MASFATMRITDMKLDYAGVGEALRSEEVGRALDRKGAEIADALNDEHGDGYAFRSFPSDRGNRWRNFVVTYDDHGRRVANADPSLFARHV